jgi:hypothetical protein
MLFLAALPVSVPLVLYRRLRGLAPTPPQRRIADALAASVVLSWLVLVVTGTVNPRYGYVTLPLLCPLAGAVVAWMLVARPAALRAALVWVAMLFLAAQLVTCFFAWRHSAPMLPLVLSASVAIALFAWVWWRMRRATDAPPLSCAAAVVLLVCLSSVPFGPYLNAQRHRRSAQAAAQVVRVEAGPDALLVSWRVVASQPELFYYSGLRSEWRGYVAPSPSEVAGGHWVVLNRREYDAWSAAAADRLARVTPLTSNGQKYYLAWLAPATK